MGSTCRSFMAAILLIAVAAVALAQDASSTPPPPQNNIMGSWFIGGIAIVALFGIISMVRRRKMKTQPPIVDFPIISPDVKPTPAPHP